MGKIWFHGVRIDHEPEFVMERDLNKDNYHDWLNKFETVLCDWNKRILGVQIESIKDIPDQMTEGEQERFKRYLSVCYPDLLDFWNVLRHW